MVISGLLWGMSSAAAAPGSVGSSRAALDRATAARVQADATVAQRQAHVDEVSVRIAGLGELDTALTTDLADARRQLHEYAVAAYIDGGQSELFRSSLSPEQSSALAWQKNLSVGGSSSADDAAARFEALKEENTPQRLSAAAELDVATRELEEARFDAIQAAAFERDAEAALAASRAAEANAAAAASAAFADQARSARESAVAGERARSARESAAASRRASTNPSDEVQVPDDPGSGGSDDSGGSAGGNPTAAESATLARIRACESSGNYSIVSASGRYRGAYQFDYATWAGVGGSGDPAAASAAEQDYRALLLLRQRGTRPWPNCGG